MELVFYVAQYLRALWRRFHYAC